MTMDLFPGQHSGEELEALSDALLRQRYARKDSQGHVLENMEQMYERVARAIAAPEAGCSAPSEVQEIAREFFQMMSEGLFLPNSPTLMNAGLPDGLLAACFVLGIEDSIEGIFEAVKRTAMVQKAGGGTGFAFDTLRPTGDLVTSSGGATSGPLSFLRVFSEASNAARRRGANMAMMSVEHPDILNFIVAKRHVGDLANFNISVKLTDAFMAALRSNPDSPHVVVNLRTGMRYQLPHSLAIGRYGLPDLAPAGRDGEGCYTVRESATSRCAMRRARPTWSSGHRGNGGLTLGRRACRVASGRWQVNLLADGVCRPNDTAYPRGQPFQVARRGDPGLDSCGVSGAHSLELAAGRLTLW